MPDIQDLPDEVADLLLTPEQLTQAQLEALGLALSAKRQEHVSYRKNSGIEDVWRRAEEAYLGIDDSNRGMFQSARWAKPTTMEGPVTTDSRPRDGGEVKSTAFVRITSRYVDAGAAKLGEILLPTNDKAFSFTATPVPDVAAALKDDTPAVHEGVPLMKPVEGSQDPTQQVPATVADVAKETLDLANQKAKKAEKRIYDWMVESRYRAEARKVIFDAARIGTGILKGPFPRRQTYKKLAADRKSVVIESVVKPSYEWADVWNVYPDPACGENIKDGDLFHCEPYTRKQVRKLKGDPSYIASAIDKVLEEGPQGSTAEEKRPNDAANKNRFTVWYYYGAVKREDLIAAGQFKPDEKDTRTEYHAICTMINDTVVRAVINPLDSGEHPYHAMQWQRRAGFWAGVGVGEQIEMPQRAINAAIRAMFNNAGKSAGGLIVVDRGAIEPGDGTWTLTPDKIFYKKADSVGDDVRKAFEFYQVPNVTAQMMSIIDLCLKLAEESTNIPLVTQGQSGTTTPETYGATQLQNNNANQLLRSVGYGFDDMITEPLVLQSYEYLLLDPTVPEDEKGDWTIDAHGSVALVERAIQEQTIRQMGDFALNPAFGVNPKLWFAEFARTNKLEPKNFQYSAEEQAAIEKKGTPPPPAVQVAQIKSGDSKAERDLKMQLANIQAELAKAMEAADSQTKLQIAEMKKAVEELRIQRDTDRDTVYVQAETHRTDNEYQVRREELAQRERLAMLDYANKHQLKLEDVKAQLAQTSAKLNTQIALSDKAHSVDLHKHHNPAPQVIDPAAEPVGKAPAGEAFTQ